MIAYCCSMIACCCRYVWLCVCVCVWCTWRRVSALTRSMMYAVHTLTHATRGTYDMWSRFINSSVKPRTMILYTHTHIYMHVCMVKKQFSRPRTWVFLPTKTPMLTFIKNIFIEDSRVSDHVESESGVLKRNLERRFSVGVNFFFYHIYICVQISVCDTWYWVWVLAAWTSGWKASLYNTHTHTHIYIYTYTFTHTHIHTHTHSIRLSTDTTHSAWPVHTHISTRCHTTLQLCQGN